MNLTNNNLFILSRHPKLLNLIQSCVISYQEALEALEELENNTFSECFFSVENLRSEELQS
jgi:hypothetical protein